jgi:PAS domain S-box-containing protein
MHDMTKAEDVSLADVSSGGDWSKLEGILRDSGAMFWEVDANGIFTYASPSFVELVGYEPHELVGVRHVDSFYPVELEPELEVELRSDWLSQHRPFHHAEVPLVDKSGRIVWVTSRGVPFFDEAGRLQGFRGTDIDITRRKEAEERARAADQFLLEQIFAAPVAIAYTTIGSDAFRINRAFVDLFGYVAEDLPSVEAWFRRAYPDPAYRAEVMRASDEIIERARAGDFSAAPREFRITCKDGTVRDIEIASAVAGDCFFGTFTDRTQRNRAEELLRASESSMRALIENAPLGIVRMDLGTGRLWVNKVFTRTLGYTAEDVPDFGQWMRRAYPDPAYRERIMADWDSALREAQEGEGRVRAGEVRVIDKQGAEHEMQFSGILLGGEVFGLWMDLTERNRAERSLRERQEQLARVGRVSMLGQLAASLAHELEQPLAAILNNAETAKLLLSGDAPDLQELRAIVEDILADDRRAGAVLDRIRGMVRQHPFELRAVPVGSLLRDVVQLVGPVAARREITLEISVEPETRAIEGDPVLLQQALLNLMLNSMDAIGPRTDGRIEIRAGEGASATVEIAVGDNGGGVCPSELGALLEPFHTTKREGLGMGLPLVQSIVEQHGGKLRLDNQPGRGLAVYLRLPVHRG